MSSSIHNSPVIRRPAPGLPHYSTLVIDTSPLRQNTSINPSRPRETEHFNQPRPLRQNTSINPAP